MKLLCVLRCILLCVYLVGWLEPKKIVHECCVLMFLLCLRRCTPYWMLCCCCCYCCYCVSHSAKCSIRFERPYTLNGLCKSFNGLYTLGWLSHSSLYLSLVLWNVYSNFVQNHFNFMHWCHSKNSVVVALYMVFFYILFSLRILYAYTILVRECMCMCVYLCDLDIFNGFMVIQSGRKWINCNIAACVAHEIKATTF